MSDDPTQITLGTRVHTLVPQGIGRIRRKLAKLIQLNESPEQIDGEIGTQLYDVLQTFIPDVAPLPDLLGEQEDEAAAVQTEATLPQLLDAIEAVYRVNGADRLVRLVPPLTAAADPSLASLARLQPGLTRVLRLVTPVTECLRRNAIPTLKTKIDDPPHSTGDPVYLDLVHSLPGQASASQNFDGNGQSIRYHVGFGGNSVTFGPLPGTTEPITGTSSEPIIGSRPRLPDHQPPFRPDVACVTQQRPNLAAETGPAPAQTASRSRPRLKPTTPRKINAQLRRRARAFEGRSR